MTYLSNFEHNLFFAILAALVAVGGVAALIFNFSVAIQVWWLNVRWAWTTWIEKLQHRIAAAMPRWLVYACTIRAGVHASSGRWSNQIVPELTFLDVLKRWGQK